MVHNEIHAIDLGIIAAYLIAMVVIGVVVVKKVQSTDDYYLGGRSFGPLVLMATVCATIIGGSGLMGRAGVAYSSGFKAIMTAVPYLLGMLIFSGFAGRISAVGTSFNITSIPDLFERRFGKTTKVTLGALIAFTMMGTVAAQVTATATIINMLGGEIGVSYEMGALIACAVFIIYTATSGLFGVIYTDVFQFVMLILFVYILIPGASLVKLGGPAEIFRIAGEYKKIDFGPYDMDLTHLTFLVMVLNGIFYALQKYGTDQSIVQRYLTARDDRSAKRASYLGIFLSVPTWALFMFVGTCLFAYYHINSGVLPEGIKSDEVFPYFIATEMPVGITGLILAALIAGAISSIDADINCISAIVVEDYYGRFRKNVSDKQKMKVGRWAVIVTGLGAICCALLYVAWGGEGVLGTLFGLYAILSAGIVGIFLLGLFSRRANWQGLYIGIAAAILYTAYAVLTSTKYGDGMILDLGDWNFTHHKYMLGVYSHLIVLVVGYVASLFFHTPLADKELTIYGYLEEKKKNK